MLTKEIWIVRHGQTLYNEQGILQGCSIDSKLNDKGLKQAAKFFESNKWFKPETVFYSTLKRSKQSVSAFIQQSPHTEALSALNEINWGDHEGQVIDDEIKRNYSQMIEAWGRGDLSIGAPSGECLQDLVDRLETVKQRLLNAKAQRILICSHGRTIRCILCLLLLLPWRAMETFEIKNFSCYKLGFDGSTFTLIN